jgi:hypothetical protein
MQNPKIKITGVFVQFQAEVTFCPFTTASIQAYIYASIPHTYSWSGAYLNTGMTLPLSLTALSLNDFIREPNT